MIVPFTLLENEWGLSSGNEMRKRVCRKVLKKILAFYSSFGDDRIYMDTCRYANHGEGQLRATPRWRSQGGHVEVIWILRDTTAAELTYLEPRYMGSFATWASKSSFLLTTVVLWKDQQNWKPFTYIDQEAQATERKIDKLGFMETVKFCASKDI